MIKISRAASIHRMDTQSDDKTIFEILIPDRKNKIEEAAKNNSKKWKGCFELRNVQSMAWIPRFKAYKLMIFYIVHITFCRLEKNIKMA